VNSRTLPVHGRVEGVIDYDICLAAGLPRVSDDDARGDVEPFGEAVLEEPSDNLFGLGAALR
jgi:hypothetical protein